MPDARLTPFLAAVAEQAARLAEPDASADAVAAEAAATRALALLQEPGTDEAVERLLADAPLLAAFFQNLDLLYAHAAPPADAVAALVMRALERLHQAELDD